MLAKLARNICLYYCIMTTYDGKTQTKQGWDPSWEIFLVTIIHQSIRSNLHIRKTFINLLKKYLQKVQDTI